MILAVRIVKPAFIASGCTFYAPIRAISPFGSISTFQLFRNQFSKNVFRHAGGCGEREILTIVPTECPFLPDSVDCQFLPWGYRFQHLEHIGSHDDGIQSNILQMHLSAI